MEKKDIEQMLEKIQKTGIDVEKEFVSTEKFKENFFKKAAEADKEDKKAEQDLHSNYKTLRYWIIGLSSAACFAVIACGLFGETSSSMFSTLSASMAGGVTSATDCARTTAVADYASAEKSAVVHSTGNDAAGCAAGGNYHRNMVDRSSSGSSGLTAAPENSWDSCPAPVPAAPPVRKAKVRFRTVETYTPQVRRSYNTEEYKSINENPFHAVSSNPLSTFGADVDTASYNNVRRMIRRNILPPRDAVRIEEFVNAFRYNYPAPAKGEKFSVTFESAPAPWNKEHQLLLIGVQAKEYTLKELPPANYVFLVDNSGSMYNEMSNVIEALNGMISNMRKEDRISLVTYGGGEKVLLDGISGRDKDEARAIVRRLRAGGGTYGSGGIQTAYKLARKHFIKKGNNRIVLVTDGDFNVGVSSESELVEMVEKERSSLIYLSTFGVGSGNYKDNKLKMLANKGNGNYFYIDSPREARNVAKKCFAGSMFALARDVKFQIEFNPAKVSGYRLLGYELRKMAARDFNDDTKDAGEIGVGHQVTALYELIPANSSSKVSGSVDALKYQKKTVSDSTEILTCKLRYQEPSEHAPSVLKVFPLKAYPGAGNNFQWASAVAEFAMLLRNSPEKGNANFDSVLKRAKSAAGSDEDGKRAEFITMVHAAKDLKENPSSGRYDRGNYHISAW